MAESAREPSSPVIPASPYPFRLLQHAGYGLLVYGIYSLIIVVLSGSGGADAVLSRISQTVALFPVLFLAPVLIFSTATSPLPSREFWPTFVRWFVLLLSFCYLLFVPLAFFNQYAIVNSEENVVKRLEASLVKRRNEIVASIADVNDPGAMRAILGRFPEISNIKIDAAESPPEIRRGFAQSIDRAIRTQIAQLRSQQQARRAGFSTTVRSTALGSLIAGIAFLTLAARLMPWVGQAGVSLRQTLAGLGKGFAVVGQPGREPTPMQRGFHRWRLQLRGMRQSFLRRWHERQLRRRSQERMKQIERSNSRRSR